MENLLTPTSIIKSNRKTLSLIINNKGELIVRAPLKCKDSAIFDFIKAKEYFTMSDDEKSSKVEVEI